MKNIVVLFEEYSDNVSGLVGYNQITGHLVFDIKLSETFCIIVKYCSDVHKTGTTFLLTFRSIFCDSYAVICRSQ